MSTVAVAFLIATGWTLCVVLTVIGPLAIQNDDHGPFYAIAGAWCFVTSEYSRPRIYLHYAPMLTSAFIITVLYVLVALVLFGVLVVDGNKWRFKAPPRQSANAIRDFFGQFSWGRLHRPSGGAAQTSESSGPTKSASLGRIPGSIRLGSLPPRHSDVKSGLEVPEGHSAVATIDISQRPDTGSSGASGGTDSTERERGRKATAKTIIEPKALIAGQTQMSISANQVSGKALQLKTLAIKMLWYPIVYLLLVIPIAVTRVDLTLKIDLLIMLCFMCLLWLMGTANTIIYVCTRRLGPTPWSRRTLSTSRSRSKGGRTQEATTVNDRSVAPVQIFVDMYTQRATDEQFIEIAREKSAGSSVTGVDIQAISSRPPVLHRDSKDTGARDYRENKVEFDFGGSVRHHLPRQGSLSGTPYQIPHQGSISGTSNSYSPPRQPAQPQEPSTYTYTLPRPINPQEQQQISYQEPHPYSRAQSPTHPPNAFQQPRTSHEGRASFPPYYYEDDDDSLRTNSRTHSRKGSANGKGIGVGF